MSIKFGIREKLLAPLIIGLAVIICILFLFVQPTQLKKAKQQFIESQTNIIKTLSPSIVSNILANDLAELHRIFENSQLIHKEEWLYIELLDQEKKQIYPIFTSKPKKSDTLIKINFTIEENLEIFGYLTLYTDWGSEKNKEEKYIKELNRSSILLFFLIAVTSFILQTKWIYVPIKKLKEVTSKFSQGEYTVEIPRVTNDEVGLLTRSIEQMRDKIQYSMNELIDGEQKQRAILESVPDAIITIDEHGTIQSFNPGAEKTFYYNSSEVIGKNVTLLMPQSIASHHNGYLQNFKMTHKSQIIGLQRELYGVTKHGDQFPIELTVNAKIIKGKMLFTGILRDITERKKVDRLKSEFVSTVSHELRTPLTAIKGSLDIITNSLGLDLPEQATTMLDVASRNVERLLTLINDILDVSKLESGEMNFFLEDIKISSFIDDCIELNQEYAKKHDTKFICTHCEKDATIKADKDRLTQVMSNLLSNAAKYSPADVPVEIFTTMHDKKLRINIKDHGSGIPKEFQDVLFEKFTQSDSGDTRRVGGTGLGLSISKMIIEKLGGNIGFDTIEGQETIFYFELPIVNFFLVDKK